jgi:hypothetical protein
MKVKDQRPRLKGDLSYGQGLRLKEKDQPPRLTIS